ncbi:hypothetical protein [Actinomycetospora callitridis]|uniref:hypothetical protein n=1 Tax=Actinomycetospora callitridis TaxID=913944 RepID=UPI0023671CE1|nr:hypothetical protein [Actinomycetospora callitridis]MDD7919900.1 hypothetical protein [Actinomycetospora callitridis]
MTDTHTVDGFFATYAQALLARDEQAVADLYAVPALILFPGTSIPVTDAAQTAAFFGSSWDQYEGVDTADPSITVMAEGRSASGPTSRGTTATAPPSASATSSWRGRTATGSPS